MAARHILADVSHRPWPLPRRRWALAMSWHDLLFIHWPVPAAALREHIPTALALDSFEGTAWLGVVPFRMSGVRPRLVPSLPRVSAFPELNVRTYVVADGKPGVWFFSLDAADPIAVRVARTAFHLPYFDARMSCLPEDDGVRYASTRTHRGAPGAAFRARYQPTGPVYHAAPGSLEHWLTERYCLYAAGAKYSQEAAQLVWRSEIHHARWPLQPAAAELELNTMAAPIGLDLPILQPLLHFARRLDVVAWLPQLLSGGSPETKMTGAVK